MSRRPRGHRGRRPMRRRRARRATAPAERRRSGVHAAPIFALLRPSSRAETSSLCSRRPCTPPSYHPPALTPCTLRTRRGSPTSRGGRTARSTGHAGTPEMTERPTGSADWGNNAYSHARGRAQAQVRGGRSGWDTSMVRKGTSPLDAPPPPIPRSPSPRKETRRAKTTREVRVNVGSPGGGLTVGVGRAIVGYAELSAAQKYLLDNKPEYRPPEKPARPPSPGPPPQRSAKTSRPDEILRTRDFSKVDAVRPTSAPPLGPRAAAYAAARGVRPATSEAIE